MNQTSAGDGESHSISRLIALAKRQDSVAVNRIWQRYFERLLPLARARLANSKSRVVDEEDILVSVFDKFFLALSASRFSKLSDRDDLWQILLMLTERKLVDHHRRSSAEKRGGGSLLNEADLGELDFSEISELQDIETGPEFVAEFNDSLSAALGMLNDSTTREVALLKLEGNTNHEVSAKLSISISSVERKLRMIRDLWNARFSSSRFGELRVIFARDAGTFGCGTKRASVSRE